MTTKIQDLFKIVRAMQAILYTNTASLIDLGRRQRGPVPLSLFINCAEIQSCFVEQMLSEFFNQRIKLYMQHLSSCQVSQLPAISEFFWTLSLAHFKLPSENNCLTGSLLLLPQVTAHCTIFLFCFGHKKEKLGKLLVSCLVMATKTERIKL